MPHFTLPDFGGPTDDATIAVDIEQAEDNLFLTVNGVRTAISLWFHRDHGPLVVTLGSSEDRDEWTEADTIPIPTS